MAKKKIAVEAGGKKVLLNFLSDKNSNFETINYIADAQDFKTDKQFSKSRKPPTTPDNVKVINMKDERDEQDFFKTGLSQAFNYLQLADVNSADVSQLEKLLYINDAGINKIVKFRADGGVFYSQDEFFDFIGLKPHERAALKPYILAGECISEKIEKAEKTEPVVARPKNRRIIDY